MQFPREVIDAIAETIHRNRFRLGDLRGVAPDEPALTNIAVEIAVEIDKRFDKERLMVQALVGENVERQRLYWEDAAFHLSIDKFARQLPAIVAGMEVAHRGEADRRQRIVDRLKASPSTRGFCVDPMCMEEGPTHLHVPSPGGGGVRG